MSKFGQTLPPYPLEGVVEEALRGAPDVAPSGDDRGFYLDLAEPFVRLLAEKQADDGAIHDPYWEGGESPTGTARFGGAAAVLLGARRCTELLECAAAAMDYRCHALQRSGVTGERLAGPDFETRDLMLGLRFLSPLVNAGRSRQWRECLGGFDPESVYVDVLAQHSAERIYNWNVFALCGEWLKYRDGVADNRRWIDDYVALQLPRFNEFGLYRDLNCPFTYDLTVRQGFSWMFANGYAGARAEEVDELLRRGALTMLLYLSPLGQTPYGGRSNQFHHTEAMAACICEFEATRYAKRGDRQLAGAFKRQARLCARATAPWLLGMEPPRHLKNRYPPETLHGCDPYGHYGVYGLLASNLFGVAYLMADDSIEEAPTPAEMGGTLLSLPDGDPPLGGFHRAFATCQGYHLEFDTHAQPGEDATGLGRLHRRGVPSWVGLSSPAPANPLYVIGADRQQPGASACAAWQDDGGRWRCLAELPGDQLRTELRQEFVSTAAVSLTAIHAVHSGPVLTERLELSEAGLTVSVSSSSEGDRLGYCVPVPIFDGERHAEIEATPTSVSSRWEEGAFGIECLGDESRLVRTDRVLENRNGALAVYRVEGCGPEVQLRLSLTSPEPPAEG